MYKIDECKLTRSVYRITIQMFIALITLFYGAHAMEDLPIIGVLGLENKCEYSESEIEKICNSISAAIEQSGKYYVFRREYMPSVFEEKGLNIKSTFYYNDNYLQAAGNLLSVHEIIGGTIYREDGVLKMAIIRITVLNGACASVQHLTASDQSDYFSELEIQIAVKKLIADKQRRKCKK